MHLSARVIEGGNAKEIVVTVLVMILLLGYGRADKGQVQQMVKMLLNLNAIPKPDDAADAMAVAICHAHSAKINEELGMNRL